MEKRIFIEGEFEALTSMCGFSGIVKIKPSQRSYSRDVANMSRLLKHRGPDDDGLWSDARVFLGFKRLSIHDLTAAGNQPMLNEDGTVVLVFNGEIYNFQDLKFQLVKNHRFVSKTDTEVLLHGYEEWGISSLLDKIEGAFAFCIYDLKEGKLYLVRDRIGEKPLYYFNASEYFAFASETKAFFPLEEFSFGVDEDVFDLWMGFPYLPDNEKTLIKGVKKIPPASFMVLGKDGQTEVKKYWRLSRRSYVGDFAASTRDTEKLLQESVAKRLEADVPVGILLSGGLDSSLITALAKRNNEEVRAINISFENSTIDESPFAEIVAKHLDVELTKLRLDCSNLYQSFKDNIQIYDDLSSPDGGFFSTYLMSQAARKLGVNVLLTGEGADEVFGGYSWFGLSQYPFRILPRVFKSLLYYYAIMRIFSKPRYLKYVAWLDSKLGKYEGSFFEKIQHYEIEYSLPNHYCMKLDKGASAASVEARVPYLDYKIVELLYNLPRNLKIEGAFTDLRNPHEKSILREIAKKYLPPEIFLRKKQGGMLPVYEMLELGIKNEKGLILENRHIRSFFSRDELRSLFEPKKFKPLVWQREWLLWKCLIFALWYDFYGRYEKN